MATLTEVLSTHPRLSPEDVEWLTLLVGDWQLLADLSFADLVLWVSSDPGWAVVAHVRPTTGQTLFFDDQVGHLASAGRAAVLSRAEADHRIVRGRDPEWGADTPIREESIPVIRRGRVLAILTRHTNLAAMRTPSRLELTYLSTADALVRMIAAGDFPHGAAPTGMRRGAPRVGDGVLRLDAQGQIRYASPNAVSALHRLGHVGDLAGHSLARIVTDVLRDPSPVDEGLPFVLTGRQAWRTEVCSGGATVTMRAIPLTEDGVRVGAVLLLRDVSELRRREQELLTKDATIREIHHRVKNNLQSVAALLRLQARRMPFEAGRVALAEAVRRVGTIAFVHETLSQGIDETVDFDAVVERALMAVVEVVSSGTPIDAVRKGQFGRLRAEDATSLAMIVSELVQNAAEHGLRGEGGRIVVEAKRSTDAGGDALLTVTITDNGLGLPTGMSAPTGGLGVQIVRSLVRDLQGTIDWKRARPRGTRVRFVARLRPLRREPGAGA